MLDLSNAGRPMPAQFCKSHAVPHRTFSLTQVFLELRRAHLCVRIIGWFRAGPPQVSCEKKFFIDREISEAGTQQRITANNAAASDAAACESAPGGDSVDFAGVGCASFAPSPNFRFVGCMSPETAAPSHARSATGRCRRCENRCAAAESASQNAGTGFPSGTR